MSNVWGTRYRLRLEQLGHLADWLGTQPPHDPLVVEEHAVRLLTGVVGLLQQHQVNHRGQCRFCGWAQWRTRLWRRRPRCTVYRTLDFVMTQSLDVVWWQLFQSSGRDVTLDNVRDWILQYRQTRCEPGAENDYRENNDREGDDTMV